MVDNLMLYVDVVVAPDVSLDVISKIPGLIGIVLLLFGLVWDSK
jgi:hypothetical protein